MVEVEPAFVRVCDSVSVGVWVLKPSNMNISKTSRSIAIKFYLNIIGVVERLH